jgi:tricorn protease
MRGAVWLTAATLCVFHSATVSAAAQEARLLRRPTVSRDAVAFAYAGDLWIVERDGGKARRLTSTPSIETDPRFSPDGSQIAFTASVKGNTDVFIMPSAGGAPRRLTHHPGLDLVRGWTHDGQRVIFGSARGALPTPIRSSYTRLWTVTVAGGMPEMLPMPRAYTGSLSPDGRQIAYEAIATESETLEAQLQSAQWRHYRGGRVHPIRVMNLADHSEQKLPWRDSNDSDPMWIGDTIYFVSDRNFTTNLFAYRAGVGDIAQLTHHDDYDVMNASAGPDAIVYEQAGYIHLLDVRTMQSKRLHIRIDGDFPWAQAQTRNVAEWIRNMALSADGTQVAIEARGEIFVQPASGSSVLNLTQTAGAHERSPAWAADGRLAWLSDASGEYQLFIVDPSLRQRPRVIDLPVKGYFSTPSWSPDGRYLLLQDNHLTLWLIELVSGKASRVDTEIHDYSHRAMEPVWSTDSRWIAYSKGSVNHLRAVFLYSLAERKAQQLTDSKVDAISPAFDRDGKYLYFLVSTDYGRNVDWTGTSTFDRPVTRTVHAVTLSADSLPPDATSGLRATGSSSKGSGIDVDGLSKRIVSLDIPPGDYANLIAGPPGTLFYTEHEKSGVPKLLAPESFSLQRYQVGVRKRETLLKGIDAHGVSADGRALVYRRTLDRKWAVAAAERSADSGDTQIDTNGLRMTVEPRVEWPHIFREAWRIQRDYFYQPNMHGADWQAIYEKYAPFLPHVKHRVELGYLMAMVGSELAVGHSSVAGWGDVPQEEPVNVGMLGADYVIEQGHYRIRRIYSGDPWNLQLRAPLAVPGAGVAEGDYLLEVDGKPVAPPIEIYALFEGTAGKPTQLRVGPTPGMSDSRLVTVTPIADEEPLRTHEDWVERNRKAVDRLSGGRLGYVWLPNTWVHGYQAFNREFYGQLDKEGIIVDVRYNQGGILDDHVIEALTRTQFAYLMMRDGADSLRPAAAIYGPKVMVINESAGSGGDALPYYFRLAKVGPLVGTRTWGGLVGAVGPRPTTLDGGSMSATNATFYDLQGRWLIENEGVTADIEVENVPAAVIAGRDPQLERAVAEALRLLKKNPSRIVPRPTPPDRVSRSASHRHEP